MTALVTVAGDGTFRMPGAGSSAEPVEDVRLDALVRLRSLLGDDLEDAVAARLHLPQALGTEPADHLLPASLTLLAGTTADLASYGWRLGTGRSLALDRAHELGHRTLEAARIALLGYEGPAIRTVLGPVTLGAAVHLRSGERALADRGALRDLPVLLAEGIAGATAALVERVPGVRPGLLVREDAALAVHAGRIPTPSGYRRYPALPAPEIGALWRDLHEALVSTGTPEDAMTLAVGSDPGLLAAARTAGWRRLAIAPMRAGTLADRRGRSLWEAVAEAHDAGIALEIAVDPAAVERDLDAFAASWTAMGLPLRDTAGLTLIAHRAEARRAAEDPAAEPASTSLLTEADLVRVLRAAPAWAERVHA